MVHWWLCFFVTCVLMLLFALYFLWIGSYPFLIFIHGFCFAFHMMWNILHFGLACVCAQETQPCSFLVSFTFSALLSYISPNPRTQLQNWLKERDETLSQSITTIKRVLDLGIAFENEGNINMTCSFWWISSPLKKI
jgi:hypothetical protein